jgi:molybdopterin-guanine dinucleotide biosynthesis protein A
MGDDKGLLLSNKKTWVQLAQEKLALLPLPTAVSINSEQEPDYKLIFSEGQLVIDDHLSVADPLLGVLSVHKRFASQDLMILACDLPLINQEILETLHHEYKSNGGY